MHKVNGYLQASYEFWAYMVLYYFGTYLNFKHYHKKIDQKEWKDLYSMYFMGQEL